MSLERAVSLVNEGLDSCESHTGFKMKRRRLWGFMALIALCILFSFIHIFLWQHEDMYPKPLIISRRTTNTEVDELLSSLDIDLHFQRDPRTIMTLFTTWIEREDRYYIQNMTVRSWVALYPWIQPVLFTDDANLARQCRKAGWAVLPMLETLENGKPLLRPMFVEVKRKFNTPLIGFSNGDILFTKDLLYTILSLRETTPHFLDEPMMMAGARRNLPNTVSDEAPSWTQLEKLAREQGTHHLNLWAIDYFIVSKHFPAIDLPDIAIALPDYDNFMIWFARFNKATVIDLSNSVLAIHIGLGEGKSNELKSYNTKLLKDRYPQFDKKQGWLHCSDYFTSKSMHDEKVINFGRRVAQSGICTLGSRENIQI